MEQELKSGNVCQYCLCNIKEGEGRTECSVCGAVYHSDCWEESAGCSVYGCARMNYLSNSRSGVIPVKEMLIHIEYLINNKKHLDALTECNRLLNADRNNTEAKLLFNRVSSLMNTKMKILESADESFNKKDFKSAGIFYLNYIKYCDDIECDFINAKLQFIQDRIPQLRKRKILINTIYTVLLITILSSLGFLAYYYIYMQEDREFAEIENGDSTEDVKIIEHQIVKYERFLRKYEDGKNKDKAREKVSALSEIIAEKIYSDDWRTALTYVKKIDNKESPKTYSDLLKIVRNTATKEYKQHVNLAKKYDKEQKFPEAKNEIDKAMSITEEFSASDMETNKQILAENRILLNKKIKLIIKFRDIDREISDKSDELKRITPVSNNSDIVILNGIIIKKSSVNIYIARDLSTKKLVALKSVSENYNQGDDFTLQCIKSGKININDDTGNEMILPFYKVFSDNDEFDKNYEKDALIQRLGYLKAEKEKIDSLLHVNLL